MEPILLPSKLKFKKGGSANESVVELEPCFHGYGMTIGNALRRVLLSSLSGAAITAIKIEGVSHEFSAVPNVMEDMLELILNLKQVRFRLHSDEPVRLKLEVSGEKEATAANFEENSQVEIVNPSQHIATLTDKKAELKMEVILEKGRGYQVTEESDKSKLEAGMVAIDAIFTPVKNVAIKVENVRVGQITNFDKLVMTIETDGTITPQEAVRESAKILIDHFNIVMAGETKEPKVKKVSAPGGSTSGGKEEEVEAAAEPVAEEKSGE